MEIYKTTGTYSLHIDDNLSQIQRETNAFLLIVRHNTEIPPFADWQLRHQMFFFFVGLKNRVNLVLFFKPWFGQKSGIENNYESGGRHHQKYEKINLSQVISIFLIKRNSFQDDVKNVNARR